VLNHGYNMTVDQLERIADAIGYRVEIRLRRV
jgi:hypothetical protein